MTPTFRVTARIRNNRLIAAREALGWSQSEAARRCGIAIGDLCALECLRARPQSGRGGWRKVALQLSIGYGVSAEELFPEAIDRVVQPVAERTFDLPELPEPVATPEERLLGTETHAALAAALAELPDTEQAILRRLYGLDGDEIGHRELALAQGCSRSRVWQREQQALRALRKSLQRRGVVGTP